MGSKRSGSVARYAVINMVVTVLAGLFFLPYSTGRGLANLSYDLLFAVLPASPPTEAVLVGLDEDSRSHFRQSAGAPWDREIYASLVRRLAGNGARAIVFDVWFAEEGTNSAALIDAIVQARRAGVPVIVGATIEDASRSGKHTGVQFTEPFEALKRVALWGWAEQGEEDEVVRRHFAGRPDHRGDWAPSLAWLAADSLVPGSLQAVPARRWINYYGPAKTLKWYPLHEVLEANLVPPESFAGKVCFVGELPPKTPPVGGTRADLWRTPHSRWTHVRMPGVEITATVCLNLLRGDWLQRFPLGMELGWLVITGWLFGYGLARVRPGLAVCLGLAGALVLAGAGLLLVSLMGWWFCWLVPCAIQVPVAVVGSMLSHLHQLTRENSRLETQLDTKTSVNPPAPWVAPPADIRTSIPDHELLCLVGRGAYGEVWLARNAIGMWHAVKILQRSHFRSEAPYERELRGLERFMPISREHPGLVQVLHVGRNDLQGWIYYVMEVADDETSGGRIIPETYSPRNLAKEIHSRGSLPAAECLQLGLDLSSALGFLHNHRLIHRDIKPANIIYVKGLPKLADIGLVTDVGTPNQPVTFVGTEGYMAPEGPGSAAADVYSLGKVLYEAGTGRPCSDFPDLPSTLLDRPDRERFFQLNEIILKACQSDPELRYPSADALHAALQALKDSWN